MRPPTLDDLRRYAISRSLFKPTTLPKAISRLGFVQADPIRAPARAQDLTLRHRVTNYRAGDLERRYPRLPIEEDFFINYGFVPRELMWRDAVIGWGNIPVIDGKLVPSLGYVRGSPPRDPVFRRALDVELARMKMFLGLEASPDAGAVPGRP